MTASGSGPSCTSCSRPATGNFCQHCGAELGGRFCNQCGSQVAAGAKFCNQCGDEVKHRGGGAGRGSERRAAAVGALNGQKLPWWIAGASMFVLIMVLGLNMVRPEGPEAPATPASGGPVAGGGVAPDISQMSPIEAATRLFNRVMTAISDGDSAQAQAFLPMAIGAYERARPLDHDALFHLSMLNRTAWNLDAAIDNAEEILDEDPNHLLALAAAAEAAIELGLGDEAERHYRRILEVYDEERQRPLLEYEQHDAIIAVLEQDAERYLATR